MLKQFLLADCLAPFSPFAHPITADPTTWKRSGAKGLAAVCLAASSFLAANDAYALNSPAAIEIDGGPLGSLNLTGVAEGYGYYISGLGNNQKDVGSNVADALIGLQKTSGILGFNIQVGSTGGDITVGTLNHHPGQTQLTNLSTGPLYTGYLTVTPPDTGFTLSAGMVGSLEGYEGLDYYNPTQITTDIWWVENGHSTAVEAHYSKGPATVTVAFGDGWDTKVFNFLQAAGTYNFNANNSIYVFYGGNLGRTGLNARTYGSNTTVGQFGSWFINSQMYGAFYTYTAGNLQLIPEAQYVYAKPDAKVGIAKFTSNLGAAVFGTYNFGTSPYSMAGWVDYEKSIGNYNWFIGPEDESVGISIAPTWQYKYLYSRLSLGGLYLLHNEGNNGVTYGYGNAGTGKFQFVGSLEAGVLF